jgi:hypothetical protein
MIKCFYCIHENAKYEIVQQTRIAEKDFEFTAQVCSTCMPVNKYLLKEYKSI